MPEFALPQAAPTIGPAGPAIAELLREPSCSLAPLVAGVVRNENYYMAAAADGIERYLERRGGEERGTLVWLATLLRRIVVAHLATVGWLGTHRAVRGHPGRGGEQDYTRPEWRSDGRINASPLRHQKELVNSPVHYWPSGVIRNGSPA